MIQSFFQKQYDFEIEQKRSLDGLINIPIVALTILGGAVSTLVAKYEYSQNIPTLLFSLLILIGVFGILRALYFVITSFMGYRYHKVAPAPELASHLESLFDWHKGAGETDEVATRKANEDFEEFLNAKLAEASEKNSDINILRGNRMHEGTKAIAISFVVVLLATPFYLAQQIMNSDNPQKIEIVTSKPK